MKLARPAFPEVEDNLTLCICITTSFLIQTTTPPQ
jgi:hypothetical protein